MQKHQPKIQQLSLQIQVSPTDQRAYKERSQQFTNIGEYQQAVNDLSKSLYLQESCQSYIERGKIYASTCCFTSAIRDYEQAHTLYVKDEKKHCKNKKTKQFIQKSICVKKIPEMKEIVRHYEKAQKSLENNDIRQLKEMMKKVLEANENMKKQLQLQKQQSKKNYDKYEEQMKCFNKLREFQQSEIQRLRENMNFNQQYEELFYHQIENSTMSLSNKDKCKVYYKNFTSEMEQYYLVAKVMKDFDEKRFKFQDFKQEPKKKASYYVQKIFAMFDKYSSKVQRIQGVIEEVPYVGTAFKVVKSAAKGVGWFENVKIEHQCQNIIHIRSNITSFNKFSLKLGYLMYKNYKIMITQAEHSIYWHSSWEKVKKKYKDFKKVKIKHKIFPNINEVQFQYVREMAQIHASIIMVGVAYGIFKFSQNFDENLESLFQSIDKIEERLKLDQEESQEFEKIEGQQPEQQFEKKKCSIY